MSSINPQITAATKGDRLRAAEFNKTRSPAGPDCTIYRLLNRADDNLFGARQHLACSAVNLEPARVCRDLHDARNLIALALSLLEEP